MKRILRMGMVVGAGWLWTGMAGGQEAVITSIQTDGQIRWTNAVNTNSLYRVEWAASLAGPWYRTFDNVGAVDGGGRGSFSAAVPMFYRVVMTTNPPPPGMVWIDAGWFEQGQTGIETPVNTHYTGGFWMDEMEVTKAKWNQVHQWALTNGYAFTNPGAGKTNNHPAQTVDWHDCVKWCNARSQMEKLTPCYYTTPGLTTVYATGALNISNPCVKWDANGYRLPTEAEWEKAARGGRYQRRFPWGDTIQHARANYHADSSAYDTSPTKGYHPDYDDSPEPYTSPAGSFPATGAGLHDLAGNVAEWCWDWWAAYSAGSQSDPRGPATGTWRIVRGGSCYNGGGGVGCAYREYYPPTTEDTTIGFRCVRGP